MQATMKVVPNRERRGWDVVHAGMPHVGELFGTDTLPTPYSFHTPRAVVVKTLQGMNPKVAVA